MKATIKGVDVEGTPDELARFARMMAFEFSGVKDAADSRTETSDRNYVSEDVAFRTLKRRPLSVQQRAFLATLLLRHPEWVSAKELEKSTGYSKMQFGGLLGAFGKRISATEGYVPGSWFYDQEWDYEQDCNRYRLPSHLVPALKRAGI